MKNPCKNEVKKGGRVGIDFSWILVGLGGQVGRPNRARRAPKRDLTGQGRPQEGERSRQASQVRSKVARRSPSILTHRLPGGGGVYLTLKGGTSPGLWTPHLDAIHFSFPFSMPSWIDLGSIFPPNLPPKIHQNPLKIDAKMPSHLDSIF